MLAVVPVAVLAVVHRLVVAGHRSAVELVVPGMSAAFALESAAEAEPAVGWSYCRRCRLAGCGLRESVPAVRPEC